MKQQNIQKFAILSGIVLALCVIETAFAQSSYEINWWDVNSGGGGSSGGRYQANMEQEMIRQW